MSEAYREKYRSNIDKQVENAGLSKGLKEHPGAGQPLPDRGRPYRENWWLQDFIKRKDVSREHYLPTSLLLKRKVEEIDHEVAGLRTEGDVRDKVTDLNKRIQKWLRAPTPPQVSLGPVDADAVVERWRRSGESVGEQVPSEPEPDETTAEEPAPRPPLWKRIVLSFPRSSG